MPTARRRHLAARLSLALGLASGIPHADVPPPRQAPIPTVGRSIAGNDGASAVSTNPANLGFLPSAELRWSWVRSGTASPDPARGHAFDVAVPLPFHLGAGMRLDFVRPQAAAHPIDRNYTWLTGALAFRPTSGLSAGLSVQHAYAGDPRLDGPTTLSTGLSLRPFPHLGLSVVARDLNAPTTRGGLSLGRSYDVGVALRPTGRRNFEIGLEEKYLEDADQFLPRATLGVDVPLLGRLIGEVTTSDPARANKKRPDGSREPLQYTAAVGLQVAVDTFTAEGGALFGSGLGGQDGAGFFAGASVSGNRQRGIPAPAYALRIRLEGTPGPRAHVALLRRLWRAAQDKEIAAVVLVLKAEPAASLAHAEEVGDAIRMLRAQGKKVVCDMEDAAARSLYVCSQADRVTMNPGGLIRFAGLKLSYQYYAALLEKLGIRAHFVRIGAHKSAPEAFTRTGASDVARADHEDLLREYESVFLSDIGGGRHIPLSTLKEITPSQVFKAPM